MKVFTVNLAMIERAPLIAAMVLVLSTGFAVADEGDTGRYRVVNSTVNVQGQNLPVALMVDSRSGESWYLALTPVADKPEQNIPTWQPIYYYPDLGSLPPPGAKSAR